MELSSRANPDGRSRVIRARHPGGPWARCAREPIDVRLVRARWRIVAVVAGALALNFVACRSDNAMVGMIVTVDGSSVDRVPGGRDAGVDGAGPGSDGTAGEGIGGAGSSPGPGGSTGSAGAGGSTAAPDGGNPCAPSGAGVVRTTDPAVDCCPTDPAKTRPGVCGCGLPDVDTDGDTALDCVDECPADVAKILRGACGCGVSDADGDADQIADCVDGCPLDAAKATPGSCGCGRPDADTDGDGVLDCLDGCPRNATRITPGVCGCGGGDTTPLCLVHRYSFNDTGTTVQDAVGAANGTAVNVALTGNGSVTLAGLTSNQYVRLPAGIISSLGDRATVEIWVSWNGAGGTWQHILDFGDSDAGPGNQGTGQSYLFVSPAGGSSMLRSTFTIGGAAGEWLVNAPTLLPTAITNQVAVVMDGTTHTMALYLNGAFQGQVVLTESLSSLNDLNNWLGRSQFASDPEFAGTIHELRIYSAARNAAQMLASFNAGPDALPGQ